MRVWKRSVAMVLVIGMTLSQTEFATNMGVVSKAESISTIEAQGEETMNEVIETFEDNMEVEQDDTYSVDESTLEKELDQVDMEKLLELYRIQGLELTEEELADLFMEQIESVNEEIEDGDLVRLEQGTLVEAEDDGFYVQGGSTYSRTYWWGMKHWKSTPKAKDWVYTLNRSSRTITLLSAGLATIGIAWAGLATTYIAYQMSNLSDKVSQKNDGHQRGIVAKIYPAFISSVAKQ